MIQRFLPALWGFFFLVSCANEDSVILPPVNEFLVVGNDRGFRDDYINQANLVTVHDSSITVRSLRSVDNPRTYPIVAGYVHGGNDPVLHWAMDTIGQDTVTLRDTSRNSTFYLHRLNRVDSLPGALPFLTSGEVENNDSRLFRMARGSYVFNDGGQAAGCVIDRSYMGVRDWRMLSGSFKADSMPPVIYYARREVNRTLWRLYDQFAQPVLVRDNANDGLSVTLLDSLSSDAGTLYGRTITERSFRNIGSLKLSKADTELLRAEQLQSLGGAPLRVNTIADAAGDEHRTRWQDKDNPEDHIVVTAEEFTSLNLRFTDTALHFESAGETLASTGYTLHPSAPYLITGDECNSEDHWHYAVRNDSVTFTIPLRVDLPTTGEPQTFEVGDNVITVPPGNYYLAEEWKATYLLGQGK